MWSSDEGAENETSKTFRGWRMRRGHPPPQPIRVLGEVGMS